jgi:hypothetical protein
MTKKKKRSFSETGPGMGNGILGKNNGLKEKPGCFCISFDLVMIFCVSTYRKKQSLYEDQQG